MWYKTESNTRPTIIDTESSKKWVYVRKNIEEHEREDETTGIKETFYSFEESKIPKDVWLIFQKTVESDERIADLEEAVTELYGIF